jgi:hypothetical protein
MGEIRNIFLSFLHHFCVLISFSPFPSHLYVHSIVIRQTYCATAGDSLEYLLLLPVILLSVEQKQSDRQIEGETNCILCFRCWMNRALKSK